MMSVLKSLGNSVYQVNLIPDGEIYCTTGYLIIGEDRTVIIEPGASRSNSVWLKAFDELKINSDQIDAIITTHIHLDHSGGAGILMEQCKNAIMLVHEKGAPHIIDPEKLINGAKLVYGEKFEQLFAPVEPIAENRVVIKKEGDDYEIGKNRTLRFYNAPGHALHHFFIYDPVSEGIFSGDSAGIYYSAVYNAHQVKVPLPSTTPTQYDPEAMTETLNKMLSLRPKRIYYTHFGMAEPAEEVINITKNWLTLFHQDCLAFYQKNPTLEALTDYLQEQVLLRLEKEGVPRDSSSLKYMKLDNNINAQGIIAYDERLKRLAAK